MQAALNASYIAIIANIQGSKVIIIALACIVKQWPIAIHTK